MLLWLFGLMGRSDEKRDRNDRSGWFVDCCAKTFHAHCWLCKFDVGRTQELCSSMRMFLEVSTDIAHRWRCAVMANSLLCFEVNVFVWCFGPLKFLSLPLIYCPVVLYESCLMTMNVTGVNVLFLWTVERLACVHTLVVLQIRFWWNRYWEFASMGMFLEVSTGCGRMWRWVMMTNSF